MGITSPAWIDFLEAIKTARASLGSPDIVWYRGHPNAKHYLLASLLRYKNGLDKEKQLFASFRKFSERILARRNGEWETLFEMQHYGIPTRLLDWSETFGVALFFAATYNQSHHKGQDAAIYLLDPIALNMLSRKGKILQIPQDETGFGYTSIYWEHEPMKATAPIAVEPRFLNDRMLAQRGMFTIHHDNIEPLEVTFSKEIKKVVLPAAVMPAALEFLELSNLHPYSIFPDVAGLAEHLKNNSGLEPR